MSPTPGGPERAAPLEVGSRVKVFLDSRYWRSAGWFEGTVIRIEAVKRFTP